jgi:formylglycine-generating enzyme required for sulfatase activity
MEQRSLPDGERRWMPAGSFRMGSDERYPEEAPARPCRRYRLAARMPQPIDTSSSHLGLRHILRA